MTDPIADIPSEFDVDLLNTCRALGVADPMHFVKVWFSESDLSARAHNPNGNAVGIFQVMPLTLEALGFPGTPVGRGPTAKIVRGWEGFLLLGAVEQLKWARAYYRPHFGRLFSVGTVYLATFLPAVLQATHPELLTDDFVVCTKRGTLGWAFDANLALLDGDKAKIDAGKITLGDLAAHAEKRFAGPRALAISQRIHAITGRVAPELPQTPDASLRPPYLT